MLKGKFDRLRKMNWKLVASVGFAVFWVYGMLTLTAVFGSTVSLDVANSFVGFAKGYSSLFVANQNFTAFFIILNNMLVFTLLLYVPYNISVAFTGFIIGCVLKVKGLVGAAVLPVLGSLYVQPFAIFELGAYVVAITVAIYSRLHDRGCYEEEDEFRWSTKYLLAVMVGFLMLMIAGQLEAALL